eukprot:CAMPEP_0185778096 /NCGR_PEP_ID=MMETSP1174-20130828/91535_1 /TAXON_ID=35687 /ORGANISM="Dictyocha speculum, Strain CCMP1381" /LENGTH=124 /DNA_ID=CAMNT_0028466695 /DNA_START=14 /DNA_END=386 /DNA_ORIENTATION=+
MASEAVMVPATIVTVQNVETVPVQAGPVQATVVTPQAVAPPMVVQAKVAPVQATLVSQPRAVQAGLVQPQNQVMNSTPAAGTSTLLPQHPQGKFRFDLVNAAVLARQIAGWHGAAVAFQSLRCW